MAPGDANWHTDTLSTAARLCAASLGTHGAILDDTLFAIETFQRGDKRAGSLCEQIKAAQDGTACCTAAHQAGAIRAAQLGGAYFYACHAELVEAIVPVYREGAILGYVLIGPVLFTPLDPFLTEKIARRLSNFQIPEQAVKRAAGLSPVVEPERLKQTVDLLGKLLSASSTDVAAPPQDHDADEARQEAAVSEKNRSNPRSLSKTANDSSVEERFVIAKLRLGNAAAVRQDIRELVLRRAQWHPHVDVARVAAIEAVSALWRTAMAATDGSVRPRPGNFDLSRLFKAQTVSDVLEWAVVTAKDVSSPIPQEARSALKDIQKHIRGLLGGRLSCAQVAHAAGMDSRRLTRLTERHLGISLREYLVMEQLAFARKTLRESDRTATQVAVRTGFSDQSNFTKVFRKYEGITPIQYRKHWIQTEKLLKSKTK